MSNKSRAKRKMKRDAQKRAEKQAQKAKYAAWAAAGITKGSKRAKSRTLGARKVRTERTKHKEPFPFKVWMNDDGTWKSPHPHKAYLAWKQANA